MICSFTKNNVLIISWLIYGIASFLFQDTQNDCYCWICHKEGDVICYETCPRVFHLKCIQMDTAPTDEWVCPECILMMTAENMDTRSRAMRLSTVDQLCVLLKHALSRMRTVSGMHSINYLVIIMFFFSF